MKWLHGQTKSVCVLLSRVLSMVVMTRSHNKTSAVTRFLLCAAVCMCHVLAVLLPDLCHMGIAYTDFKIPKMSVEDCC